MCQELRSASSSVFVGSTCHAVPLMLIPSSAPCTACRRQGKHRVPSAFPWIWSHTTHFQAPLGPQMRLSEQGQDRGTPLAFLCGAAACSWVRQQTRNLLLRSSGGPKMLLCEALCASATGALSVVIPGQLVSDGQTVVTPLTVVHGDLQPRRVRNMGMGSLQRLQETAAQACVCAP